MGLASACVVSGYILAIAHFRAAIWHDPSFRVLWFYGNKGVAFWAVFGRFPALAFVAISEFFAIRKIWYSVLGLIAVEVAVPFIFHFDQFYYLLPVAAIAGALAGCVYWLIAGRYAGLWRQAKAGNQR